MTSKRRTKSGVLQYCFVKAKGSLEEAERVVDRQWYVHTILECWHEIEAKILLARPLRDAISKQYELRVGSVR